MRKLDLIDLRKISALSNALKKWELDLWENDARISLGSHTHEIVAVPITSIYQQFSDDATSRRDRLRSFQLGTSIADDLSDMVVNNSAKSDSLGQYVIMLLVDKSEILAGTKTTLDIGAQFSTFNHQSLDPASTSRHFDAFSVGATLGIMKNLVGSKWSPAQLSIWVSDPTLLDGSAIEGISIIPWEHGGFKLAFPTSWLDLHSAVGTTVSRRDDLLSIDLESYLDCFLETRLNDPSIDLEYIAKSLGVTKRRLQRQFSKDGISLTAIKARVKSTAAIALVLENKLSNGEMAAKLGYSDASAFGRSFKAATGYSPSQYRNEDPD